MNKHISNESYGWEESRRHTFSRPSLSRIKEVPIIFNLVFRNYHAAYIFDSTNMYFECWMQNL